MALLCHGGAFPHQQIDGRPGVSGSGFLWKRYLGLHRFALLFAASHCVALLFIVSHCFALRCIGCGVLLCVASQGLTLLCVALPGF
eukprot:6540519-Pyramimonas_sp.AAC.1